EKSIYDNRDNGVKMRKIGITLLYMLNSLIALSEIGIKIFEPIRFKEIITNTISSEEVIGEGVLEIATDNLKEDKGKKLKFYFPKKGLITNRKKWVKIKEYRLETKNNDFIVTKEVEYVRIYVVLNKRDIDSGEEAEIIEGEYIGYVPIIVSQYGKLIN
ncbi:MAG: hypothetical protein MR995_06860, partial [Fusobacterium mortiferum]|nr:hypothetical protein [Fusobacterium mortiferum]